MRRLQGIIVARLTERASNVAVVGWALPPNEEHDMGRHSQFRCDACGYEAVVSGGPDVGFAVETRTIACAKCKQLFDVVTSEDPGNPKAPRIALRCPRSRTATHPVKPWKANGPCPSCGGKMQVTGEVVEMWD